MMSWKRSFDRLNEEYETVFKKKQALNSLLSSGKISQSTFEAFDRELDEVVAGIEKQKKALLDRISLKTRELEEQVKVLERLLANFEIQHVGGEVDEETYQRETALLNMGIENAKKELNAIKETMDKLGTPQIIEPPALQQTENVEAKDVEVANTDKLEVEVVEIKTEAEPQVLTENPQEALPAETKTEQETVESQ
ncbi:CdvA-like protein [Candidatus Bathyarchaeota archaeon]|nr:CdvA-like protein [Candidatus Bathyarchaeota archaeon]